MKIAALALGALILWAPGDWRPLASAVAGLAVSGAAMWAVLAVRRAGVVRLLRSVAADLCALADGVEAGADLWHSRRGLYRAWARSELRSGMRAER
jgi:hypothetical protein